MAAAGTSGRAARDGMSWGFAYPILSLRSIPVTGIWADSGASVERGGDRRGAGYAQQAPSNPTQGAGHLLPQSQAQATAGTGLVFQSGSVATVRAAAHASAGSLLILGG
jgi:hypothetical protein